MTGFKEQEYNNDFDLGVWKQIFKYMKKYKKYLIMLGFIMVSVAGIDIIFPLMTRRAIDNYVVPGNIDGLGRFAIIYGVLIIIQVINVWAFIALAGKVEMGIQYDIRKLGFKKLQELSFTYYDKTPTGWIMARMTSDVRRLGETISWGLVDSAWGLTFMSGIAVVLLILNFKLALITLTVVPILAMLSIYFQKKILKAYRDVRKINSQITGSFSEGISGAKTTKTLVREEENLNEFKDLTGNMRLVSIRAAIFSALFLPIVLTLGSIGTGLALWFGGKGVLTDTISYGTLVAFLSYTALFFEPVRELARVFAELQAAQASAERVLSLVEMEPTIKDREDVIEKYGDILHAKDENWEDIKGDIEYRNVTFKYESGEKVLDNFNLNIRAGETIALVGETGSGKSTIVNLACRFYEPSEGEVLIDGIDYRERSLPWLHSNIGYVLQSPHLFSGTIIENIRYGSKNATEMDVIRAAKLVNAHEFITKLEKGYDTQVGEGGGKLSTGQKQLISFARAIVSNPKIFVLDEATSSIDTETEKKIQDAIQKVLKGRTSFIIAHRLSTIVNSDRILVVKKGKIVEEGTHKQLIQNRGYYYNLYTNQFKEEKVSLY
ncbi:ABC transporter ATP-binding protein [Clostridium sp. D2Q-11]|uniref:ABC transporter ATP-binding protein n=1 Tax=Anaeromonas frigoriresistens TaxID=2683708 RepID=A0A942UZR0_9FIRM|nr:ABC transporter ATP-binding protein [Anaeromonas frigoriresistens]MBS4537437.1 ABC transporter ATP-binding protein [Anaeromonas frigoriresistens]